MSIRDYYYNLVSEQMIKACPQRIISLVPSVTETLFSLGLEGRIAGRTDFCVHPAGQVDSIKSVGGPKNVDYSVIDSLKPDLIIADKEENTKKIVEELSSRYPVYLSVVESFDDALRTVKEIGIITGTMDKAEEIINNIKQKFEGLNTFKGLKAAYLIWKNPYMAAGRRTFINSILEKLGFINPFTGFEGRYPMIEVEDIKRLNTDVIFLASEPFTFGEEDKRELEEHKAARKVILVDGEMFCWPGSHMLKAPDYFRLLQAKIEEIIV
ncbi:MAG TPA: ABC transporter substrate-binding protein [Clostridiaceae bacterium]|nr:ABC transporter substrate-binding protein [Clostridiaceae bacterium]